MAVGFCTSLRFAFLHVVGWLLAGLFGVRSLCGWFVVCGRFVCPSQYIIHASIPVDLSHQVIVFVQQARSRSELYFLHSCSYI